ncbi:MAG: ABC transporter permease [Gammaproteobacteria bacterium]|nr:ABC transporter permease [Gammaproteobacteria bacterium]MYC25049.1 ABC transporter permease [Gammaproteobacteria bacterium]
MPRYIGMRLLQGIFTVWFIATATFWVMHSIPGDPLESEKAMSPEIRANLEAKYGLDKNEFIQYWIFLGNMVRGDFGWSFEHENRRVNDIIAEQFPVSATLGILAIVFAGLGGVLWGALTALYRNKWPDVLIIILVILGISVPSFVFATVGQLGIVTLNKIAGIDVPVAGWGTVWHMLIPALVLGLGTMAFLTRLMRTSMLEIVNADYIRTARSKGVPIAQIFSRHQLRNAILPVLTVLGPSIAGITTGGFVVENVFGIPGLGKYFVTAVQQSDYGVIMGTTVFYGAFLVLMVIIVDLLYAVVDPRVRLNK